MSIVSSSDHWLFISSTGGLSAGRASAEQAIFPYYTDDKITENSENTGNKAILLILQDNRKSLWSRFRTASGKLCDPAKPLQECDRNCTGF
jgi:hypothetical protein